MADDAPDDGPAVPEAPPGPAGSEPPRYGPPGVEPPGPLVYAPPGIPGYGPPGLPAYAPPGPPAYAPPGAYGPPPYPWAHYPPVAPPAPRYSPEEQRRRRRRGLLVSAVAVVAFGGGIALGFGIGAWTAPPDPVAVATSLVHSSVAAGTRVGSFHYVERSTNNGRVSAFSGVAGRTQGTQTVTQQAASGLDHFDLRLVNGVVYFHGNRAALIDQLGVPAAKAAADTASWIRLVKGDAPYKTLAAGITAGSNLSQIPTSFTASSSAPVAGSSPPATRIAGGLNAGKGQPPVGSAALIVTTASSLPRSLDGQAVATNGARLVLSWTFTHWGAPVKVSAPATSVPYSSLGATPPSGG